MMRGIGEGAHFFERVLERNARWAQGWALVLAVALLGVSPSYSGAA